jgi:DNA-directed RNA polymerase subunit alpha
MGQVRPELEERIEMEPITEQGIDLFADESPSMEDLEKVAEFVHSGEMNRISFGEQLESEMGRTSPKAVLAVGIGLFIVGRDAEAVKKLEKAKECKEKFMYLAFALRRLGRFDEAVKSLQKSLDYGVDPLSVTLEKAATCRCAGEFEAAAKELKGCANFENVSAEYHYQLGRLQEVQGFYEEAAENYRAALDVSPEHQRALFHLAYRCDLSGDEGAAINYYKQIACTSSVYVNALLNLAVLYEDMERFGRASECVDKVLKYHPNHQRALLFKKDIEGSKTMFIDEEKEKKKDRRAQILETPISDFELSVRSRNCFKKMNIETLGDLMNITEVELLSYKNFGETSLREIKIILSSKGLHLGMALEEAEDSSEEVSESEAIEDADKELLEKPVEELNLSVRAKKCLQRLDINTLTDLTRRTDAELLGCKNFGVTSLNEIRKALGDLGLSLRSLE